MEAAGIILATIPLIMTALDKYVETLERIRLFRTDKYRRYLERYSSLLGANQASLLSAIETAVGFEISLAETSSLLGHSRSMESVCRDPILQARLQANMGRDYDAFLNMTGEARHVLQELYRRLEEEVSIPFDRSHSSRAMREIRRAKNILSKKQYDRLFNDLETSISLLKSLVDQSLQRQERGKTRLGSRCEVVRSPAASIYRAFLREEHWCCPCRDGHSILFMINPSFEENKPSEVVFHMAIATPNEHARSLHCWQEFEVEPAGSLSGLIQISQICATFGSVIVTDGQRKAVGSLSEGGYEHTVFIAKSSSLVLESQSLENMLMYSPQGPWIPGFFPRKDRLRLATRLAWSVLHLHGNWLPEHWRSRDIIFPKSPGEVNLQVSIQRPYLAWGVSYRGIGSSESSSAIPSGVLFPLGLALIELSQCRPMSALQIPQDENPEEAVSLLKTANRCMDAVSCESGERYGTVVRRCLYWSETKETSPDDREFQAAFQRLILAPLLDNLKEFDSTR